MKYMEISIDLAVGGIEPTIAELAKMGITDMVVEDPRDVEDLMKNSGTYAWDYLDDAVVEMASHQPKITIYLEDTEESCKQIIEIECAMEELKQRQLRGEFGAETDFGTLHVESKTDDDSQWKDKWKEYFKPAKIAKSIVVKPTWEEYDNSAGNLIIEIDPGMAFGTGTHETTSMCVKMMEDYMKKGDKIMDVGCGSGILSIAAALLGAEDVLGIDIDPIAVEVSKDNVRLNQVSGVTSIQYGDLTKGVDYCADIVVANLMSDLVMMLSEDVSKHLKSGGKFISSGILIEQEIKVVEYLRKKGFGILEVREEGEWCCIVASNHCA